MLTCECNEKSNSTSAISHVSWDKSRSSNDICMDSTVHIITNTFGGVLGCSLRGTFIIKVICSIMPSYHDARCQPFITFYFNVGQHLHNYYIQSYIKILDKGKKKRTHKEHSILLNNECIQYKEG